MATISPSLLSWDFTRLGEALEAMKAAGATLVHVDASDGHFAGEITLGPPVLRSLRRATDLVLEVHLLVERPERYVAEFLDAGADRLAVHAEATANLHAALEGVRGRGGKAGVAVNPATPLEGVVEVMPEVDFLTVLTADPALAGSRFIPAMLEKVKQAAEFRTRGGLGLEIEAEGGIRLEHAERLIQAGADILVVGSAILDKEHPEARLSEMIRFVSATNRTLAV